MISGPVAPEHLRRLSMLVSVTLLIMTFTYALTNVIGVKRYTDYSGNVRVHIGSVSKTVSNNFLSVALDSAQLSSDNMWNIVNSPAILHLAQYLSPGYLRIGGNAADLVVFDRDSKKQYNPEKSLDDLNLDCIEDYEKKECSVPGNFSQIIMTGEEWLAISAAARKTGLTVLFDLNVLLRLPNGNWNSSNARELLDFSKENNVTAIWQLGNEPNHFSHRFGIHLSPKKLGRDFLVLKRILSHYTSPQLPFLVGPDVTRPLADMFMDESTVFLREFLSVAGKALQAVTWHQYCFDGKTSQINDFLNVTKFDVLSKQIRRVKLTVQSTVKTRVPIWISETSTAFGGGARGLSDRFVASFSWLDKLGVASSHGIDVVIRQSLIGGSYGLIDQSSLEPLPDWWVSLLFKRLVGSKVLQLSAWGAPPELRVYAHCATGTSHNAVLYGVNLADKEITMDVGLENIYKEIYVLTAPHNNLTSKSISLNGRTLSLLPDGSLPQLDPEIIHGRLSMPAHSLFFIVQELKNQMC